MDTTDTQATFTGSTGVEQGFRVRARDYAQNLEPWPAGADATTVLYTWPTRTPTSTPTRTATATASPTATATPTNTATQAPWRLYLPIFLHS